MRGCSLKLAQKFVDCLMWAAGALVVLIYIGLSLQKPKSRCMWTKHV